MEPVFHPVAKASAIRPGTGITVKAAGRTVAIFNAGGTFYALDGICSHGAAELADGYIEGELIECPQHAGSFELGTGKAVGYPCTVDVASYPVTIAGDELAVGIVPDA